MPDEVARRVPETKDYQCAVADNRCWCHRRPRSWWRSLPMPRAWRRAKAAGRP